LPRLALTRREEVLQEKLATQEQIDSQAANIDKLYEGIQVLERKIADVKRKKDHMVARARTAKSTQKVNDMLSGVSGTTSMDAFRKMEDKVLALEAAAEVSAEQMRNGALVLSGSKVDSIEMEFRGLEASDNVDKELNKLEANMLLPSSTRNTSPEVGKTSTIHHVLLN